MARVWPSQTPAANLGGDTACPTCALIDTPCRNAAIVRGAHRDAIESNAQTRDLRPGVVARPPRVTSNTGVKFRYNPKDQRLTKIEAMGESVAIYPYIIKVLA